MARHITEERDLRSLERRSMYSIFAPLDANETMLREPILDEKRKKTLGRGAELAGALWPSAPFPSIVLISSAHV